MRPVKRRKLRGIEVAQAALLLVIGVVVGLVLYFITVGMASSTPDPHFQLDGHNSFITGNAAYLVLKFGKSRVVTKVDIIDNTGASLSICSPAGGASYPLAVKAGQEYLFICPLNAGKSWPPSVNVRVYFADRIHVQTRWVTG